MSWVIKSDRDKDENGAPLYWVMDFGWGSLVTATVFPSNERAVLVGTWQRLSEAEKEVGEFSSDKF